ncbi:General stress protein CTC [Limihaloglobus sulfuriphilus]|uniref:Large ribosomal subunit protein bL25 n=1 Tax=Limihaloglobus sulfuriphilus TaxID=1851148 RepID=A0A1Q2MBP9_9BACT|nr:50S ribosomal protein L25 [Limihaloglobus sulfuriphilus]AQQ70094.1 General stress protein CTC [Limihaloglobus sulfuriphilus]
MTETIALNAEQRDLGTKVAAKLRSQGKLPAVIYGHKQKPVHVTVDYKPFFDGVHHGNRLFTVKTAGKNETLLVKDLQFDHLGKNILHADLMRVDMNEKTSVTVPVILKGDAVGFHKGGILETVLDHIEIETVVSDIPENLTVSVKDLDIGDAIHAKDIQLPENAELLTDPDAMVAICHLKTVHPEDEEEAEEGAEEALEPEVIGEKKSEEEEE